MTVSELGDKVSLLLEYGTRFCVRCCVMDADRTAEFHMNV